jgi:hypothetical protein
MRTLSATRTALGIAFALAITLTGTGGLAFAETPKYEQTKPPTIVDSNQNKPKFEQAKPESIVEGVGSKPKFEQAKPASVVDLITVIPEPVFQPDVRVVFLGSNTSGGDTLYQFRVDNAGAATAENISLGSMVSLHQDGGTLGKHQEGVKAPIAWLGMGQSQEVTVACTPLPGYHCNGASLSASLASDSNPNNNSAHS